MNINWKGDVPKQPLRGQCEAAVTAAAGAPWNTTGQTFVGALIRGADHDMTTDSTGKRVHDQRHITVNFKDAVQQGANKHTPAHVYLQGVRTAAQPFTLDRVEFYPQKYGLIAAESGGVDDEDESIEEDEGEAKDFEEGNF